MAKKKKKKDRMMKKMAGKNFEQYRGQETLLKSGPATETEVRPLNPETYNRADATMAYLKANNGYRQKVRMKK